MIAPGALMRIDQLGFVLAKQLCALSWQLLLLAGAATVAAWAFRRSHARVRHLIWMAVFGALPLIPFVIMMVEHTGSPQFEVRVIPVYSSALPGTPVVYPVPPPSLLPQSVPEPEPEPRYRYPWAILLAVYGAGVTLFLGIVGFGCLRIVWWRKRGAPVTDQRVLHAFDTGRDRLGIARPVALFESHLVAAPLTVGVFRPMVLIPAGFARGLADSELRAFALHELAHVKRLDSPMLLYVSVLRALMFFNPVVWYAARQVAGYAENACDDAVIVHENAPLDYAEMLVRIAGTLPRRELTTELSAGFIVTRHHFFRRVEEILADRGDRLARLSRRALTGCMAGGLMALVLVATVPVGEVQEVSSLQYDVVAGADGSLVFRAHLIDSLDGRPVQGVRLSNEQFPDTEIVSDENGDITLAGFAPGAHIFNLSNTGGVGRWWSPDCVQADSQWKTEHDGPTFSLMAFEVTGNMQPVTIMIEPTMTITGTVYDPVGNPVSGATVAPARTGSGNSITGDTRFSVRTDDTGRYTIYIPDSSGNEYHLVAHDGDYGEFRGWANGISRPMKMSAGDRMDNLDIVLSRPVTISGVVLDSSGNPAAGHEVMISACDGTSNRYCEPSAVSDENGRFEIAHIRPGEIWVCTPPMFIMREDQRKAFPEDSRQRIMVEPGKVADDVVLVGYTWDELTANMQNNR